MAQGYKKNQQHTVKVGEKHGTTQTLEANRRTCADISSLQIGSLCESGQKEATEKGQHKGMLGLYQKACDKILFFCQKDLFPEDTKYILSRGKALCLVQTKFRATSSNTILPSSMGLLWDVFWQEDLENLLPSTTTRLKYKQMVRIPLCQRFTFRVKVQVN